VGAVVICMMHGLGHDHRRRQAPTVRGGDLAGIQIEAFGQDLPLRAQAANALREIIQRDRPVW